MVRQFTGCFLPCSRLPFHYVICRGVFTDFPAAALSLRGAAVNFPHAQNATLFSYVLTLPTPATRHFATHVKGWPLPSPVASSFLRVPGDITVGARPLSCTVPFISLMHLGRLVHPCLAFMSPLLSAQHHLWLRYPTLGIRTWPLILYGGLLLGCHGMFNSFSFALSY